MILDTVGIVLLLDLFANTFVTMMMMMMRATVVIFLVLDISVTNNIRLTVNGSGFEWVSDFVVVVAVVEFVVVFVVVVVAFGGCGFSCEGHFSDDR